MQQSTVYGQGWHVGGKGGRMGDVCHGGFDAVHWIGGKGREEEKWIAVQDKG